MNKLNKKKQSGGILSAIAALFKGGAATGGVSGAAATGGIFATKAGILGLLLGGATIAAGAGAVYHFAGGSSANTAYMPELFQNSYMEEQAAIAEAERAQNSDRRASVVNSTIGMFSEQAKRSGLGFGGDSSFNNEEMPENSENAALTDEARGDAANVSGENSGSSVSNTSASSAKGNKLAAKSMSSIGGASTTTSGSGKTVVPRMTSMGGLSGGVNGKFASMKSAGLAEGGKSSRMTASARRSAAKGRAASPRAGGNNRALGQARFANSMGNKAVYSASTTGARTAAAAAFTGETAGDGSVEVDSMQGAGMGGAGISMVDGLKSNNPNSSRNVKNVPEVSGSEDVSPWKGLVKTVGALVLAATAIYLLGKLFVKLAKKPSYDSALWSGLAKVAGIALLAIGAAIVALSLVLGLKYKQWMYGIVYGLVGGLAVWQGYQLMQMADDINKEESMKKEIEVAKEKAQNPAEAAQQEAQIKQKYATGYDSQTGKKFDGFKSSEYKSNYSDFKADSKAVSEHQKWVEGGKVGKEPVVQSSGLEKANLDLAAYNSPSAQSVSGTVTSTASSSVKAPSDTSLLQDILGDDTMKTVQNNLWMKGAEQAVNDVSESGASSSSASGTSN